MAYDPGPVPSVKSIVTYLDWLNKVGDPRALAVAARNIMLNAPSARVALDELDALLGTHGVEEISGVESFKYLNTGDTHTSTIIRHRGRWKLGSWGGLVESLERRGVRFE